MSGLTSSETGHLYADIGIELEKICRTKASDLNKIFAYIEAGDGWVDVSIFNEFPNRIRYFFPNNAVCDILHEAWQSENYNKRWAAMEYETNGQSFTASFKFPDQLDPEEFSADRRTKVLKARYGDKPIHYPPI